MTHIVRVTAQNLSASVYDTNDLSTIRGGSLALLNAVEELDDKLADLINPAKYTRIFVGASELLGLITLSTDGPTAAQIADQIKDQLSGPIGGEDAVDGRHFNFGVTVEEVAKNDVAKASARADACLRTRQYQMLSFPLPESAPSSQRPCALDRVRPAVGTDGGEVVSNSVLSRRRFGRRAREAFYDKELRRRPDSAPVADMLRDRKLVFSQSLSDLRVQETDKFELRPALSGKIALIHLDGNGFHGWRSKLLAKPDEVRNFSEFVRTRQTGLLARLLKWALARDHMICTPDPKNKDEPSRLRFETLLWGGDEMVFAVPAWAAWDLVLEIEKDLQDWQLPEADVPSLLPAERNLTHAIGLAYGNYKTPIRQFRTLAEELCDDAKEADKSRTVVSAFVAESVDLPRGGVDRARRDLLLGRPDDRSCCFAFVKGGVQRPFHSATEWFAALMRALDRSQAMELALKAREWDGGLPAANAGSDDGSWAAFAQTEIKRVVRGPAKAMAIECLGLDEKIGRVPLKPNKSAVLPLMVALHLWDYVQPFGPDCHFTAGKGQD